MDEKDLPISASVTSQMLLDSNLNNCFVKIGRFPGTLTPILLRRKIPGMQTLIVHNYSKRDNIKKHDFKGRNKKLIKSS